MSTPFKIGIWNAWIFMSVFIIQMIAISFIDKQVWKKSHIPVEAKRNKRERYASIIGNFIRLVAMVYSAFLPLQFGTVWFYIGLSVFLVGLIFITIATHNFITTPVDQVITKGVYRISRHPMYLATFLICLGTGIAIKSWLFTSLSIIMALCFYQEALIEERHCLNRYNNAYRQYKARTPGLMGMPRK